MQNGFASAMKRPDMVIQIAKNNDGDKNRGKKLIAPTGEATVHLAHLETKGTEKETKMHQTTNITVSHICFPIRFLR